VEPDPPETEAEILRRGAVILADHLPAGWSSTLRSNVPADERIDGFVEVTAADGQTATLVVETKRIVEGRDVGTIREQLDGYVEAHRASQGLVVARYLSPPVRRRLADAGLSYVDATGNVRVSVASPGLFLSDRGADADPWRGPGRPRGTLKGAPAGKIVRALADFAGPWRMRALVEVARVSTGAAYRVVDFLEREGLVVRDESNEIVVPDWTPLLRRWSDDYGFVRNSSITRWIAPRGLPDLVRRVAQTNLATRYVFTGTLAAAEWAAYAPARSAMVYVEDGPYAAASWGLRPVDAGANVLLAEPQIDVVFERPVTASTGITTAAPTQVVVDLMTGPGRNPSEAEELLEWMKRNEQSWRGAA
jgi:hypothetical protein